MTLIDNIQALDEKTLNNVFFGDYTGVQSTYAQLIENAGRMAVSLQKLGVRKGSFLAIYSSSNLDTLQFTLGTWMLGAVAIPLNTTLKDEALKGIASIVKPEFLFKSQDVSRDLQFMGIQARPITYADRALDTWTAVQEKDLALVLFTSGSSGIPKGVPITHEAIYKNVSRTSNAIGIKASDKLFINTPAYTTSSVVHCLTMLVSRGQVHIDRATLFGKALLEALNKSEATIFGGVPVHFIRLNSLLQSGGEVPHLHRIINSGDHLPKSTITQLLELKPNLGIHCIYGLTEVAGRLCILPSDRIADKAGSVGFPLPGMKITARDEQDQEVPAGKTGVMYVEGDMLMEGYLNNPEVNKKEMTPLGFRTGDLGYKDEEGFIFLLGRDDDVLKIGGEKASIKLIEDSLAHYPGFSELMIVIEQSEHYGSTLCLYYVVKQNEEFSKADFLKFAKAKLPMNHIPTKMVEVEEIPRTASGKAIRKSL